MSYAPSPRPRSLALAVAAVTTLAAVPLTVHHRASHPDEAAHLEHDHGRHGGLLDRDEARIPATQPPAPAPVFAPEPPEPEAAPAARPGRDDFLIPEARPPPQDLPRAPPPLS